MISRTDAFALLKEYNKDSLKKKYKLLSMTLQAMADTEDSIAAEMGN